MAKVAFNGVWVSITPKQLGPIMRALYFLALSTSASSSLFPSAPVSLNPAEITKKALVPMLPIASTASIQDFGGTTRTASSGGSGRLFASGYTFTPIISLLLGLTGKILPL